MAPAATDESVFDLGFVFDPSKEDVITYYLPLLIEGEPMHATIRPFIHFAEVYGCEPGDLAARFRPTPKTGDRFFFTTRKLQQQRTGKAPRAKRAAGSGSWNAESSADLKNGAGAKIGELKKLRYKKDGALTDWRMDEYSCFSEGAAGGGGEQHVLCRIYVSPRAGPDSAARKESTAFVPAPPRPKEEPAAATAGNKRPAAQPIAKTPCPKRVRGALVAPIRPPPPAAGCTTSSFASPRPGTPRPMLQQLGRLPAPATQQASLPRSSMARQLPSAPPPAPVQQAPLTPRPGPSPSARLLLPLAPLSDEDPAYQTGFKTTSYASHQIGMVTMMQQQPAPEAEVEVTAASPEEDYMDDFDFTKHIEDLLELDG